MLTSPRPYVTILLTSPGPYVILARQDRLEAMGVANLATVELELIKAPAMLIE